MSWQPTASIANLRKRSELLAQVRGFFDERGVLEVQTSVLGSDTVTDVNIQSVAVPGYGFLQTSPEYQMKRLLSAGMSSCYQICPVFRDGERGKWHNPEFTMLEWYRLGFTLDELVQEVCELCDLILGSSHYNVLTVRELLKENFGKDIFTAGESEIIDLAGELGLLNCDDYLVAFDFLLDQAISKRDRERLVLIDYPIHGAALAKTAQVDNVNVARRFEIVINGLEIANGYDELLDARVLMDRMQTDNRLRKKRGLAQVEPDRNLIAAMEYGLPDCAGVAVGLDRLFAMVLDASEIEEVMPFPWES